MARRLLAGIDAGGTTFRCGIADEAGALLQKVSIPTTTPEETIIGAVATLQRMAKRKGGRITALGVAAFGPVDVDATSTGYGTILDTPKAGWSGTPLRARLASALDVPVHLDTDVNGALAAEMRWGAARGVNSVSYITIGTGIGAGIAVNGVFAGRPHHPELGHIRVKRHADDQDFPGTCPFHGDCLEGLAAGPAIAARFGNPELIEEADERWTVPAYYLAQACLTLSLTLRLQRIVLGGGVMQARGLLARIRHAYVELMNLYVAEDPRAEKLIVPAGLGSDAGLKGALAILLTDA